jgi:hypothetical protein
MFLMPAAMVPMFWLMVTVCCTLAVSPFPGTPPPQLVQVAAADQLPFPLLTQALPQARQGGRSTARQYLIVLITGSP